ncbi:hypothetical protein WMW75_06375 [Streptococcus suis]|uniref:hypothetical protein n=1 Tax=Streptococcus suis TaxID=1307 RepID=UPI001556E843|nr:hypothetical protein [Streptococcus suis]NQH66505.1 hypothetical protein [Streptococcus suis]NQO82552.1 hypothetical protein [Streptococcus suis]HEL1997512.1 hypothetical protein [Streptococcus suis]HEM5079135.1 hypothetical protein [Streptococcus suis]HEM5503293.1 hypothetical protein [Streptococcus suis]
MNPCRCSSNWIKDENPNWYSSCAVCTIRNRQTSTVEACTAIAGTRHIPVQV